MEDKVIRRGDKVKVIRIEALGKLTQEHVSCFLDWIGTVQSYPSEVTFKPEDDKGTQYPSVVEGECWVEFDRACKHHGETGGLFLINELEKVKEG